MQAQAMINIKYFAQLREIAAKSEEAVPITLGETVSDLYKRVADHYAFPVSQEFIRYAVNDRFVGPHRELAMGDTVVFITPVAGG